MFLKVLKDVCLESMEVSVMYVVKNQIRQLARKKKMSLGADATQELSKEVQRLVERACQRAKLNRRSTVKARDI